jgi:5-methylcytosine-specific restriction endonuclease McrA
MERQMDTTDLPKTRKEAQAQGAKYYFTGEPCKHGHIAPRKTKGACVECLKVEWTQALEKRATYFQQYNRSDSGQAAKQRYYEKNRDYVVAKALATPARIKNQYRKAWAERNPDIILANNKVRRRKHRAATPSWLSRRQKIEMRSMYQIAITMSKTTGEPYVVDHIWPLQHEDVCGLHVPWNLRVITRAENLQKSNSLPSDAEALAFPPKKCYPAHSPSFTLPADRLGGLTSQTAGAN